MTNGRQSYKNGSRSRLCYYKKVYYVYDSFSCPIVIRVLAFNSFFSISDSGGMLNPFLDIILSIIAFMSRLFAILYYFIR